MGKKVIQKDATSKELDIDSILLSVKSDRAAMNVALRSIEAMFEHGFDYFEAIAMINQAESVFKSEKDSCDRIIDDLYKAGAKDNDAEETT